MRQIWGGLLCVTAGLVLALTGAFGGADAAAGVQVCGIEVGVNTPCPVGTITVAELTGGSAKATPADWTITIDSTNCPVIDNTFTVPDGGSAASPDLFIFKDSGQGVFCSYSLTETPVDGFLPVFDPAGPYTLPDSTRGSNLDVVLTNSETGSSGSPTPTPSTTPTVTVSDSASATASATSSVVHGPGEGMLPPPALAATGTATSVRWTAWAGIALCLLGAGLTATGWRRRGRHTA